VASRRQQRKRCEAVIFCDRFSCCLGFGGVDFEEDGAIALAMLPSADQLVPDRQVIWVGLGCEIRKSQEKR